jgi:hypothetical protein
MSGCGLRPRRSTLVAKGLVIEFSEAPEQVLLGPEPQKKATGSYLRWDEKAGPQWKSDTLSSKRTRLGAEGTGL